MKAFRNSHLSYSRLSRFEQCPLSYRLQYLDKRRAEPGIPLRFGKVIHAVLESLIGEVIGDERTGPLSEDRAVQLYREAWASEGLVGIAVFEEGLQILRDFVAEEGVVNCRDVLAVEKEFRLPVGPFTVLGFIDRVDWVDDETIRVIDYKTNRQLFNRDEVDSSLQLSLYEVAARRLWPWAKSVQLSLRMLRHGVSHNTSRTQKQLADALVYLETLGWQTETAAEFPARLNPRCAYCDHRRNCRAYEAALKGKCTVEGANPEDLEDIGRERQQVAGLAKTLYARQHELDKILKTHLQQRDELVLGGVKYRIHNVKSYQYPLEATVAAVSEATGIDPEQVHRQIASVDNKSLDALLNKAASSLGKPRVKLLKAELEGKAKKRFSPRLWGRTVG